MAILSLISTHLHFLYCLIIIFMHSITTFADQSSFLNSYCSNTGTYKTNSTYQSNLNLLLPSLTYNASLSGFSTQTIGKIPDRISGLALCRGDITSTNCTTCLNTAMQDILQLCPYNKGSAVWYDYCLIRYSNLNFLTSADNSLQYYLYNTQNILEVKKFDRLLDKLMSSIADWAAYNSTKKFATGEVDNFTKDFPKIYGLVQCTPDLTAGQCSECLRQAVGVIHKSFERKQGGRVIAVRCNMRYEVYSFFQGMATLKLTSSILEGNTTITIAHVDQSIDNKLGKGYEEHLTGKILAIAIPVTVAVLLIWTICICVCRNKNLAIKLRFGSSAEGITKEKSLLIDLPKFQPAKYNLLEEKKPGEGDFNEGNKELLLDESLDEGLSKKVLRSPYELSITLENK